MFTRADQPNKVFAVATSPFSIGNLGGVSFAGDFRLLDVTNPASPQQLRTYPDAPTGQDSNNGCRLFQAGRNAAPTPNGRGGIVSWYDGAQPANSPLVGQRTNLGGPESAAVFNINLDAFPQATSGTIGGNPPTTFTPKPPSWGYPPAADPDTPEGQIEGNAADVQPFIGSGNKLMSFVSEDDVDPANTRFSLTSPASLATSSRACVAFVRKHPYELPGQQLSGEVVYVGRGCPASTIDKDTLPVADPYLANPAGKIALLELGGGGFNGCSLGEKFKRLEAAGAIGILNNAGGEAVSGAVTGAAGGYPDIPIANIKNSAFNTMAGYVPNRVLSGVAVPATWETIPATGSNTSVKPYAFAVASASNAGPIVISTTTATPPPANAPAHGLATGDRVAIAGVTGNTNANGEFTVTRIDAATFSLNGTTGNGTYTGGGIVSLCAPTGPCSADRRADFSRFRSIANATDRVAGGQLKAANRFDVKGGQSYRAGSFVEVQGATSGNFRTAVEWFDANGASLGESQIYQTTGASEARTLREATVTAPANAVKAAVKFGWVGATAEGTAFADTFFVVPTNLQANLKDEKGEWGAQRIIDYSQNPPQEVGTYRSPRSKQWPPPNNGLYMPREARMFGNDIAISAWMSDGVRALDVSNPTAPKEVGSFVPPDVADPSPQAGAGPSNQVGGAPLNRGQSWPNRALVQGVAIHKETNSTAIVAASDVNGGLYVLRATVRREGVATTPPPTYGGPAAVFPGCPTLTANVIRGTAAANTINGTTAADRIFAGTGNDVVDALAGNDCVDLGSGDDRGQGGLGNDLMVSGTGKDRASGSSGNDVMRGNSGNDRLDGGRGNDRVTGDSGNDTLLGSFGNDRLAGLRGKDRISGSRGRDRINGGSSGDRISGGSSADRIVGGSGGDRINGNSGADRIRGNSGNDRITSLDNSRDRVNCGSGRRDSVLADRRDIVSRNCERVRRR